MDFALLKTAYKREMENVWFARPVHGWKMENVLSHLLRNVYHVQKDTSWVMTGDVLKSS